MKKIQAKGIRMIMSYMNKFTGFFNNVFKRYRSRLLARIAAAGFILAIVLPNIFINFAAAYGQITTRSIELSNSATSATPVSYQVNFNPATVTTIGGITVDFCSNDPILGDTCTAPTGFTLGASPTVTTPTGFSTGTGSWGATSNGAHNLLFETNATAQTETGTGTAINFTISVVTNTSTLGSFYARIITWDTQAHANAYTSGGAVGTGSVDAGGIAMSTTAQITITSKVQEQITFCVYTASLDAGTCNAATGTTVTLGNTNGVLSTSGPYVDINTKYDIQTNALHSAVIRVTGTVLTSGSNTIESSANSGTGSVAATGYASSFGNPQFGLCTWAVAGAQANLTIAATYASNGGATYSGVASACGSNVSQTAGTGSTGGAGSATFGFNISNTGSTYGDTLATAVAGNFIQGEIAFLGNISNTNVAGIYTTILTFIATGSY